MGNEKYFAIIGVVLVGSVMLGLNQADSIPPTDAFFQIFVNDENIEANVYNDSFNMSSDHTIKLDIISDNITLALNTPEASRLGGVFSGSCNFAANETMVGIWTNGSIRCEPLP